jgi:outer membrane receptor protein involved in Fe transport
MSLEELLNVTVVTASRYQESLRETPATVIVVTRKQIEQRGYRNLVDLLQDLPGVDIQKQDDPTRYHDLTLRGHFTERKFMILQDGIRIDAPTRENLAVADNFPLYHAERVEIVYGPSSAVYGADAFGGVINIITGQTEGLQLSTGLGKEGYGYHRFLGGLKFSDQWSLSLGGHRHQSDMADLSQAYPDLFAPVDATTFEGRVVVPAAAREPYFGEVSSDSLFARLDYRDKFTLGFQHSRFTHPSSTGDRPDRALFLPDTRWENQLDTLYARYTLDLSERLSTTTTVNYSRHEHGPGVRFNNIFTSFADGYKYALGERTGFEQQFDYQWRERHKLTGGIGYEDYYAIPRTPDLPWPYDTDKSPAQQNMFYPNTDLPIGIGELRYDNLSAYAQVHSRWDERWGSVVGARYDKNSRYSATLNPRLALTYQLPDKSMVKLLYGEAFRAPSAHENYRVYGSFSGEKNQQGEYISSFFAAPNPALEPEKLRNLELSFQRQWERAQFMASAYYTEVEDLMMTLPQVPPAQYIPGAYLQSTNIVDNIGTATHFGLDMTLDYQRPLGKSWSGEFWGAYSFIDGSIQNASSGLDTELPFIATHKLKFGATFTYRRKYYFSPRWALIGPTQSNRLDPTDSSRRLSVAGYGVMDVHMGAREVLPGLTLSLSISNVFDRQYYNAGGETASSNFFASPQQPRAWFAGLEYRFK